MIEAQADLRKFEFALKEFVKASGKGLDDVVRDQSKMMVGHLIALTPPGTPRSSTINDSGGITIAAKKLGEGAIRADIAALFPTSGMKPERVKGMIEDGFYWGTGKGKKRIRQYAESMSDMERIHRQSRSRSTGRARVGQSGQYMALTRKALRNQFIREKIKDVGKLNSGWLRAAQKLRTAKGKTPAWITRHGSGPGDVIEKDTRAGLAITMQNRMDYFPKDQMRRYVYATRRRTYAMGKAIENMLEKKARRANQKMK